MDTHRVRAVVLTAFLLAHLPSAVHGQSPIEVAAQANRPVQVLSPAELDSLVAPIALYPDPLLSQVLVAATYPLEIVEAAQWLQQNSNLTGAALQSAASQQDWDPSIQALVVFPDVLRRLSENIRWTTDLGNSFVAQQTGVMDAVQRMRASAMAAGNLTSNAQAIVTAQPQGPTTIVEIQPANPEVIYVPVYDPVVIWGRPAFYPYPVLRYSYSRVVFPADRISFVPFTSVGSWFYGWSSWNDWGWRPNWYSRTVVVNRTFINRYGYDRVVRAPQTSWVNRPPRPPVVTRSYERSYEPARVPNMAQRTNPRPMSPSPRPINPGNRPFISQPAPGMMSPRPVSPAPPVTPAARGWEPRVRSERPVVRQPERPAVERPSDGPRGSFRTPRVSGAVQNSEQRRPAAAESRPRRNEDNSRGTPARRQESNGRGRSQPR